MVTAYEGFCHKVHIADTPLCVRYRFVNHLLLQFSVREMKMLKCLNANLYKELKHVRIV